MPFNLKSKIIFKKVENPLFEIRIWGSK